MERATALPAVEDLGNEPAALLRGEALVVVAWLARKGWEAVRGTELAAVLPTAAPQYVQLVGQAARGRRPTDPPEDGVPTASIGTRAAADLLGLSERQARRKVVELGGVMVDGDLRISRQVVTDYAALRRVRTAAIR